MSIFTDVLKKENEKKLENNISFSEGIQFTDANKKKVVVSAEGDCLKFSIVERNFDKYVVSEFSLKKELVPFFGEIFLDFYENGNLKKCQEKLQQGEIENVD